MRLFFISNSVVFVGGGAKISLASNAEYNPQLEKTWSIANIFQTMGERIRLERPNFLLKILSFFKVWCLPCFRIENGVDVVGTRGLIFSILYKCNLWMAQVAS